MPENGTVRGFGCRVCNSSASIGEAGELHTRQPNPVIAPKPDDWTRT
jgi:hypothetical protein